MGDPAFFPWALLDLPGLSLFLYFFLWPLSWGCLFLSLKMGYHYGWISMDASMGFPSRWVGAHMWWSSHFAEIGGG